MTHMMSTCRMGKACVPIFFKQSLRAHQFVEPAQMKDIRNEIIVVFMCQWG